MPDDTTIVEYGLSSDIIPSVVIEISEDITFTNDEETEGTIDVYMSNVPSCAYCENWYYNKNR